MQRPTAGPWWAKRSSPQSGRYVIGSGDAELFLTLQVDSREEERANALLAKAAPAMMAALQAFVDADPCAGSCALETPDGRCPCKLAFAALELAKTED